jgi:hypothetical protein
VGEGGTADAAPAAGGAALDAESSDDDNIPLAGIADEEPISAIPLRRSLALGLAQPDEAALAAGRVGPAAAAVFGTARRSSAGLGRRSLGLRRLFEDDDEEEEEDGGASGAGEAAPAAAADDAAPSEPSASPSRASLRRLAEAMNALDVAHAEAGGAGESTAGDSTSPLGALEGAPPAVLAAHVAVMRAAAAAGLLADTAHGAENDDFAAMLSPIGKRASLGAASRASLCGAYADF